MENTSVTVIKSSLCLLSREIFSVYCEDHTKHQSRVSYPCSRRFGNKMCQVSTTEWLLDKGRVRDRAGDCPPI
jgi:hypothetical protein